MKGNSYDNGYKVNSKDLAHALLLIHSSGLENCKNKGIKTRCSYCPLLSGEGDLVAIFKHLLVPHGLSYEFVKLTLDHFVV